MASAALPCAAAQQPDAPPAADARTTFLRQHLAADEAMQHARDLAARRQWDRAAEAYQRVKEQFPDALLRASAAAAPAGGATELECFIAAPDAVAAELAAAPPELSAAYRRRYESAARRALERAADDPLRQRAAARRFLPTPAARDHLETVADRAIESADIDQAVQLLETLLRSARADDERRRVWQAKRALCRAWCGDGEAIRSLLATWPATEPGPTVDWLGERRALRAALQDERLAAPFRERPLPLGRASTTAPGAVDDVGDVTAEARLWRFSEFQPATAHVSEGPIEEPLATDPLAAMLPLGRRLGLQPIAHQGWVYVGDDRSVWAIDPDAPDESPWRFAPLIAPPSRDAQDERWLFQEQSPPVFTLSAADGVIFAQLERPTLLDPDARAPDTSLLVAIDARTGRSRWTNGLDKLVGPFDQCRLDGAPLVAGDRLIAVARRRKNFGFETALAVAFDRASGALLWQTHLGEAATGGYGYQRPTRTFPVRVADRVFVHTNLGAIAALRVEDGSIAWLRRYPSAFADAAVSSERAGRRPLPWRYNATLAWRDRLIVAATDRDDVLVLDQSDGRVVARIEGETLHNPDTLAGVTGDRLYAVGGWTVAYDLTAGRVAWERALPEGSLLGRAALTTAGLFVPTSSALLEYPLDGGSPRRCAWTAAQAGNVAVMDDCVLVAGAGSVTAWTGTAAAFARLERRLLEDSNDPRPAVTLAELAMQTGDGARGVTAIDEAIRRAGGAARLHDARLKQRIYRVCMEHVADVLSRARGETGQVSFEAALQLLDRAALAAPNPPAQVQQHLRRGDVCTAAGDAVGAVAAYQQLLGDAGLAARVVSAEAGAEMAAGQLARDRIARLIVERGRGIYEAVEQRAAEQLRLAAATLDLKAFAAVAARYPNSMAAPEALILASGQHMERQRPDDAVRLLRRALGFREQVDAPRVLALLAEALVAADRRPAAAAWLDRARREHPDFRVTRGGRAVGFDELRGELLGADWLAAAARRQLSFPLAPRWSREFAEPPFVLEAPAGATALRDRVLIYCGDSVQLISAATGGSVWGAPPTCPVKPLPVAISPDRAVLATREQLLALDLASGQVAWRLGGDPADAADPDRDPEQTARWAVHAAAGPRVFGATDDGDLFAVRIADGAIDWRTTMQPRGTHLAADGRRVAYAAWKDRENFIVLLDAETGALVHRVSLAAERPVQLLSFSDDGCLIATSAGAIHAIDPESGAVLWTTTVRGRVFVSSICVGLDALYLSTDGASLSRFDLLSGRSQWATRALAAPANAALRAGIADELVYVATDRALLAIDARSGSVIWEQEDVVPRDVLPPRRVGRSVLLACELPPAGAADRAAPGDADHEPPADLPDGLAAAPRLTLRRYDLAGGKPAALVAGGAAAADELPISPTDAVHVCEPALLIRSGKTLAGWLGAADPAAETPDAKP